MTKRPALARPVTVLLAAALLAPQPGVAQTTLPPLRPAPGVAEPPSVVGRIAALDGSVGYRLAGDANFGPASINLPVTAGTSLRTEANGQVSLGIAGNRVVLASGTTWDVERLDEQVLAATEGQGESYLHLHTLPDGAHVQLTTPRGIVTLDAVGRYEVAAGDQAMPTAITVLDGSAHVTGLPTEAAVGPNQTLLITGDGQATPFTPSIQPAVEDAFLKRMLADERPLVRPAAAPPAVALMTGGDALDSIGEWTTTPEYGAAWFPPEPGYIPYRNGRWAFVRPWGWTWVDSAPWGFAPSHYGRWAEIGGRWAWCPGQEYVPGRPPVYAPALVGFIGGVAAGVAASALVGWAPLGPREPYRPAYARSEAYLRGLNGPTGAPYRGPVVAPVNIVNRNAITVVSHNVFVNSAPVAEAARPVPPGFERPAHALAFRPAFAPTAATLGGGALGHPVAGSVLGGAALAGAAGAMLRPPPRHEPVLEGRGPQNLLEPGPQRPGQQRPEQQRLEQQRLEQQRLGQPRVLAPEAPRVDHPGLPPFRSADRPPPPARAAVAAPRPQAAPFHEGPGRNVGPAPFHQGGGGAPFREGGRPMRAEAAPGRPGPPPGAGGPGGHARPAPHDEGHPPGPPHRP